MEAKIVKDLKKKIKKQIKKQKKVLNAKEDLDMMEIISKH
jgi:hypothetical protein